MDLRVWCSFLSSRAPCECNCIVLDKMLCVKYDFKQYSVYKKNRTKRCHRYIFSKIACSVLVTSSSLSPLSTSSSQFCYIPYSSEILLPAMSMTPFLKIVCMKFDLSLASTSTAFFFYLSRNREGLF